MKALKVTLVITAAFAIAGWIRGTSDLGPMPRCLPFCSGAKPSLYDFGAIALLLTVGWGLGRLARSRKDAEAEPICRDTEDVFGAEDPDQGEDESEAGGKDANGDEDSI